MVPYGTVSGADDRGGTDRDGNARRVVPIDFEQRSRLGGDQSRTRVTDEDALEAVQMLDRVTGGGRRVTVARGDSDVRASLSPRGGRRRSSALSRATLSSIANRRFAAASAVLLIVGLGATAVVLLTRGGLAPRPATSPAATAGLTYTAAFNSARALFAEKTELAISRVGRVAEQVQAKARAERRARVRAQRQHPRSTPHNSPPASGSDHTFVTAAPSASAAVTMRPAAPPTEPSPSTPTQSSPPAAATESSPTQLTQSSPPSSTGSSPSSSGTTSHSTSQSSTPAKQPAFGSNGTLGPGSSPDS